MPRLHRSTLPIALVVLAMSLGAAIAHADSSSEPGVVTQAPTGVGARSAVLKGVVDPNGEDTTYSFEFGTTTAYGNFTPATRAGKGHSDVPVSYTLTGLLPSTTYHVRLVAANKEGSTRGADATFTTASDAVGAGTSPSGSPAAPAAQGSTPGPTLGQTVNVTVATGAVLVRVPGATTAVALAGVTSIPVGAVIDTRRGTVDLETALPGARTQSATFHGGVFAVRQPVAARGLTELVLRGPRPSCHTARAAATTRRRPPRMLWGRDDHGRFRTRGSNAVATVRGTSWYMADRCDGTYTRVAKGSVSVRELRTGRTVVLRAGQSHLARAAR